MIMSGYSHGLVYSMRLIILKFVVMKMSLPFFHSVNSFLLSHLLHIVSLISPDYRDLQIKNSSPAEIARERQIRDTLVNSRSIAFTPSRYNNGHRLTNYDDRYSLDRS